MFYVSINPGFYFGDDGEYYPVPYRDTAIVETMAEARRVIHEIFPHAVFAMWWEFRETAFRYDQGRPQRRIPVSLLDEIDSASCWMLARLPVFPHSQAAELDEFGSLECAFVVNGDERVPEPGARLFSGGREVIAARGSGLEGK